MSNPSRLPGCQWLYISKVGPLPNWTSVLTRQGIADQSHCQLNSVAQGGGHGPLGLIIKLLILPYTIISNRFAHHIIIQLSKHHVE